MSERTDAYGDKSEFWKGKDNDWRWRRTTTNGCIVGATSQSHSHKSDCVENARKSGMECDPD